VHAIDVHGHFGPYDRGMRALTDRMMSGEIETVSRRALACDIRLTVVSAIHALIPYRGDAVRGNEDAVRAAEQLDDIRFWVVIDPLKTETYEQADRLLAYPRCKGIKIHPHAHAYEIVDHGEAIFAFAAERDALVLTHSGDPGSYPEDFLPFIDRYSNVNLILAHLGNSDDGSVARQVDAIKAARNGNVYVDTSSARSMFSGLIEWAVEEIGTDRILFGTDTPLYWSAVQKTRIETAEICDDAKTAILYRNAAKLLSEETESSVT
jgi:predicted TIM-barrel fold metal-dependent hydrolase